jgi:hypothetical protein
MNGFAHLLLERMTFDDHMTVDEVLDAAVEWEAGRLPTAQAAIVGTIERNGQPSAPYSRFIAIATTPKEDKRWQSLYNLVTHLDQLQGAVHTRQGRFYRSEADYTVRDNQRLFDEHKI